MSSDDPARVSTDGRRQVAGIDWPAIVGMRIRLVHACFDVNADIPWTTIAKSLPDLLREPRASKGVLDAGRGKR